MKPSPLHPWPPIIEFARAPLLVRVRDILFTLVAWMVLFNALRDVLNAIIYFLVHPSLAYPRMHTLYEEGFWHHMLDFVLLALCVMLWIAFWAFVHRNRAHRSKRVTPPARLPALTHAASFGLDPEMVQRWQRTKVTIVQFDADNRIAGISPVSVEAGAAGDSSAVKENGDVEKR
jgi:poly-beta-1,6-N-acetyl-D-glucosamine biosynthesis protein PgaD